MNIDFEQLKKDKENNFKERLEFVKFWVEYIKTYNVRNGVSNRI